MDINRGKAFLAHVAARRAFHSAVEAKEAEMEAALAPIHEKHAPLLKAAKDAADKAHADYVASVEAEAAAPSSGRTVVKESNSKKG